MATMIYYRGENGKNRRLRFENIGTVQRLAPGVERFRTQDYGDFSQSGGWSYFTDTTHPLMQYGCVNHDGFALCCAFLDRLGIRECYAAKITSKDLEHIDPRKVAKLLANRIVKDKWGY